MPLTRLQLDQELLRIRDAVASLAQNRNAFPRLFEDQVEILLGQLADDEQDYALTQLEAIVARSNCNG